MADVTIYKPAAVTVDVIDGTPPADQSAEIAALHVQVVGVDAGTLGPPDAGGVKGFESGAVTDAQWVGDVGRVQDRMHVFQRQRMR